MNTTITVFDFISGTSLAADVNLTWTGTGALSRENSHFHFKSPGFTINSHFNGRFRDAVASETVSDGTTNLTPAPSAFAQIQSLKKGEGAPGLGPLVRAPLPQLQLAGW